MKFLIELTAFQRGSSYGFEEYVSNLLRYMTSHIDEINADEIILTCRESQVEIFKVLTKGRFLIIGVKANNMLERIIAPITAIKKSNIGTNDIVLFPCNAMPLWPLKGKKLLVVHDLLFRHSAFCSKTLKFWLFRLNLYVHIPSSLRKANRIIAISDYAKQEIMHFYHTKESKIRVIYNYFDFSKFRNNNQDVDFSDIKPDYFMTVCSRVKHKNHITILKAFNIFAKQNNMITYVFVGGLSDEAQSYFDEMPDNVKNRILFFEHISNEVLGKLYKNAKAFISASQYEGLGMPVVEAMYFNCPVILSDLAVHREVSLNKGVYFKPTDYMELYERMKNVSETKTNYSKEVAELYSEINTSARYIDEINLVGGGIF